METYISCNRNELKQCINTLQITKMSNSTWQHADNSGYHADPWPIKFCHGTDDLKGGSRILKWGVNFCNNVRETKYYFNIWGIRKRRKKKAQKKGDENSPVSPPLDPHLDLTAQLYLKFFLITQHEVPVIHLLEGRVTVSNNFPKLRQNGFKIGTRDKFAIHLR